ncbi:phytoene desaturase family protein [uncultured Nocardioides sp.]|uniref:phytoene desaturase family protein n=1 Tax=uncultured Nocardioides sp. TaxID=198441 RepID=UPI0026338B75|nr:phytoene desaturase family protein [uncultured Nocardioides sp.]
MSAATTTTPQRVVVVGGGVAGLATAALLARDGHAVTLLEKNDELGGRAGSWSADGFRFDTGPSWWLMPEVFDHFFRLLGTTTEEQLDLVRLDPGYRVFADGHEPFDVAADEEGNLALFESIEPGAGKRLADYLRSGREVYDLAVDRFLYTSFDSAAAYAGRAVLRRAPRLATLLTRSLESFVAARFTDRRLRQVLGYPAVFLGSSPDRAPAMYHLMSALDLADGVRYPDGGFTRLVEAMTRLAVDAGVDVRTGAEALAITTEPRRPRRGESRRAAATGVRWRSTPDGAEQVTEADLVVGAADLHHVETRLLPRSLQTYPQAWWDKATSGPGAVLVYLGVRGELPELAHHSLFFTADWQANFDAIFEQPTHTPDPASLYVCKPSATDASVAPAGHENVFVLVPVQPDPDTLGHGGTGGAGEPAVEAVADRAIAAVAAAAGVPDLAERVVLRRTLGPGDFVDDLNAWCGGALGPAHTLRQSAFFRAGNRSRKVDGLLYAGSSTVPGIGLPMCLISAELVLKRVRGDRSVGPTPEPAPARA